MRWYWIDRFTEFVSGKYAEAVKNVTLGEEQLHEYCSSHPYLPASLIIEGLAQAGGLLVSQLGGFQQRVVLAKMLRSRFHGIAVPGDTLCYRVDLDNLQGQGAFVSGTVDVEGRRLAEAGLVFAFLDDQRFPHVQLFEPAGFYRLLRLVKLFEVGRYEDGRPIEVPQFMLDAEAAELAQA